MYRSKRRMIASACAIGLTLCCLGCRTGKPSTGLATARVLKNIAAVTASWRPVQSEREFVDAIAVLATDESFDETVRVAQDAEAARQDSDPRCASLYAKVALDCWPKLGPMDNANPPDDIEEAVWKTYHYCVAQFIENAAIHGQLDPCRGISLVTDDGSPAFMPITHHEFPWTKDDFNELHPVKVPRRATLARNWFEPGLGVPLIAIRRRDNSEGSLGTDIPFAATGILRPQNVDAELISDSTSAVLELQDPIRVRQVSYGDRRWDLARDISAPLELANSEIDRERLSSFLNPGRTDQLAGLRMLEPYQEGKIPIVFIHGLLSDRFTWADLVNDLRSVPEFNQSYQIWSFQYSTGQSFIRSAAEMRQSLSTIVRQLDPYGTDEAMSQMVLVGHSMGGLVSKLQISHSETAIWDSVATRRVEEIETTPEIRRVIDDVFFFEPLPFVRRAIFIGTPHRGAKMAKGFVGIVGSALVRSPKERVSQLEKFVESNPDVFTGDLTRRLPSSIELLRPDNRMLLSTYKLRVNPDVHLHTIIGTGRELSRHTPADGVVTVQSCAASGYGQRTARRRNPHEADRSPGNDSGNREDSQRARERIQPNGYGHRGGLIIHSAVT